MTDVGADLLAPLNTTLRYLWLNGNELDRLDATLADSFASLHHLRLGSNPLRCDCAAAWLRSFFDERADVFRGALPPTCFRPARLRGRHLSDVDPTDLRCRPPSFTALEVRFDAPAPSGGRAPRRHLRCAAVGDPTPTLYWIQPSGRTTRYDRPSSHVEQIEAVLELASGSDNDDEDMDTSISGLYTCIANNDVGNVTLTVIIPAQPRPPPVLRHSGLPAATKTSLSVEGGRRLVTATTPMFLASTPAILQSILLGDSLLQLQRLAASNAPSPPPYSLIGAAQQNRSSADLAQHGQQVPVATSRARSVRRPHFTSHQQNYTTAS